MQVSLSWCMVCFALVLLDCSQIKSRLKPLNRRRIDTEDGERAESSKEIISSTPRFSSLMLNVLLKMKW